MHIYSLDDTYESLCIRAEVILDGSQVRCIARRYVPSNLIAHINCIVIPSDDVVLRMDDKARREGLTNIIFTTLDNVTQQVDHLHIMLTDDPSIIMNKCKLSILIERSHPNQISIDELHSIVPQTNVYFWEQVGKYHPSSDLAKLAINNESWHILSGFTSKQSYLISDAVKSMVTSLSSSQLAKIFWCPYIDENVKDIIIRECNRDPSKRETLLSDGVRCVI